MGSRRLVLGPALAALVVLATSLLTGAGTTTRGDAALAATLAGPTNTARPTISGTARQGQTLTTTNGQWSGSGKITYAHQWQRCSGQGGGCVDIVNATNKFYVLRAADVKHTIGVAVTATDSNGSSTAFSTL